MSTWLLRHIVKFWKNNQNLQKQNQRTGYHSPQRQSQVFGLFSFEVNAQIQCTFILRISLTELTLSLKKKKPEKHTDVININVVNVFYQLFVEKFRCFIWKFTIDISFCLSSFIHFSFSRFFFSRSIFIFLFFFCTRFLVRFSIFIGKSFLIWMFRMCKWIYYSIKDNIFLSKKWKRTEKMKKTKKKNQKHINEKKVFLHHLTL